MRVLFAKNQLPRAPDLNPVMFLFMDVYDQSFVIHQEMLVMT